jgi:hypothetical protein
MGLFDKFRKKRSTLVIEGSNNINLPELITMTLLFKELPSIDSKLILNELKNTYPEVECSGGDKALMFSFPGIMIEFADGKIPAQCSVMLPNAESEVTLPEEVFQQNWHWAEAAAVTGFCKYEVLLTDMMSRTLEYKTRQRLFMDFLIAVIKHTHPDAVCSMPARKLIQPDRIVEIWETDNIAYLTALINVRMYNITNSPENDIVMDTVGLHTFGLPDLQIRYSKEDPDTIGTLLWNYAYYIFDNGDIIKDGNTVAGPVEGSRWKCMHEAAMVPPSRWVINILSK